MSHTNSKPAQFVRLMLGLLAWLLAAPALLAQVPKNGPAAPAEKGYVLCYLVVVLAITLGLMLVCRSSNRAKESDE